MKKTKLIIYDNDLEYINCFLDYFSSKQVVYFDIRGFTDKDKLCEYISNNQRDVLLISETLELNEENEIEKDSLRNKGCMIRLTEEKAVDFIDSDIAIYKYQSMEEIMKRLTEIYIEKCEVKNKTGHIRVRSTTKVFGFVSPYRCTDTTLLSFTVAMNYGKNQRVLYINLELYETISLLTGHKESSSLSDLTYYLKQDNSNIIMKLPTIITKVNDVDCIFGVEHHFDLFALTDEDIKKLMNALKAESFYDIIILNIGFLNKNTLQFMKECSKIYTLKERNSVEYEQKTQFMKLLVIEDEENIFDIKEIELPYEFHINEEYDIKNIYEKGLIQLIGNFINEE